MKDIKNLNINSKKCFIFDLDGTLIDSIGIWNYTDQLLIKEYANKKIELDAIQKDRDSFLHNNASSDIYHAYGDYLINKYNLDMSCEQLLKFRWNISNEYLRNIDIKSGADFLLKKLKQLGKTLILATVTSNNQLNVYRNENANFSSKMPLDSTFDFIIAKEDTINKKPHPEIYLKALELANCLPQDAIVFEDSITGVLAACGAGIEIVNVFDKYANPDRPEIDKKCNYFINSFNEILTLLASC